MQTQELIEQLHAALDADDAVQIKELQAQLIGRLVSAKVTWHDGRVTEPVGEIVAIAGNDVYFEGAIGVMAGDLNTMQAAD